MNNEIGLVIEKLEAKLHQPKGSLQSILLLRSKNVRSLNMRPIASKLRHLRLPCEGQRHRNMLNHQLLMLNEQVAACREVVQANEKQAFLEYKVDNMFQFLVHAEEMMQESASGSGTQAKTRSNMFEAIVISDLENDEMEDNHEPDPEEEEMVEEQHG